MEHGIELLDVTVLMGKTISVSRYHITSKEPDTLGC